MGEDSNTESTGKSAKSYGVPGRFSGGNGSKGKLVLGKLEELGELVYVGLEHKDLSNRSLLQTMS
jgi:hypothetical protein